MGESFPEIDRRIRSPRFDRLDIEVAVLREDALEDQIGAGKGIGVTDSAQADVFRRPGSDAFDLSQGFSKHERVLSFAQGHCATQHLSRKIANRCFALRGSTHG